MPIVTIQVTREGTKPVRKAATSGDFETANVTVGESNGLMHDIPTAGEIVQRVAAEAAALFGKFAPAQIAA